VWKVLGEMSDQHRIALIWKYLDRLSVRDMAERWSATEKAVESILFRARNDFRERYEQEERSPAQTLPARCDKNAVLLASTGQVVWDSVPSQNRPLGTESQATMTQQQGGQDEHASS
jgi:hypothetical protein